MKLNINGVSKNLRLGKGVTLNSSSSSLLSVINPSTGNESDVKVNTLISNNINSLSFYSELLSTTFYTVCSFNDSICLLSSYTHIGYEETSSDTETLTVSLPEANIDNINTLILDIYDEGTLDGTYNYNIRVSNSSELLTSLNNILLSLNLDYNVSYSSNVLTLEHGDSKYIRNIYFDKNNYSSINVNKSQDAFSFSLPIYNLSLTGSPTAPTQSSSDNSTKIATTAFVQNAVGNINAILDTINGEVV